MSHNQIWSEALSHLKAQLPGHALSAWFEPVEPIGLSDNKILLEVPNQFFAEWIESHYEKELESSLNSIGGMDYGFRFVINSNHSKIAADSTTAPQQVSEAGGRAITGRRGIEERRQPAASRPQRRRDQEQLD